MTESTSKTKSASTSTASRIWDDFKDTNDPAESDIATLGEKVLDQKIADKVRNWYEKAKADVAPIRNKWYINKAFFDGDQYVSLLRGQLIRAPQIPGRVRMAINRIRPTVRTELSRMTSQKPTATVVPSSSEDEDILAAMAGESVWEYISDVKGYDRAFKQAAFWVSVCGIGFVKQVWDSEAEDKQTTQNPPPTPIPGQQGPTMPQDPFAPTNLGLNGLMNMSPVNSGPVPPAAPQPGEKTKGDICYSAPTPFHVFVPDLLEPDIQKQPFVLHVYTMTIEQVKDRFGDKLDPDYTPTVVSTNEIFQTRYVTGTNGGEPQAKPDSCLIIEAWIKPGASNLFPEGGMAIVVDQTLVYKKDDGMPFDHGDFPFVKIENVPSGGFYSTSVLEDLIGIQKEINRSRSQVVENRNATAKNGYFYQEGALDPNKWTSKPGQLIPIRPGFKEPVPIPTPPIPGYIDKEMDNYLRDWEDISGQHQVSKGQAPSGVTAATAINFLQERDDSFMATVYDSIEAATQQSAWQSLQLCVQYWDEPRLVKAIGKDQSFATMYFTGSDLKNGTDIRIDTGTALPTSKSAMRAFVTDLMSRGLIPPDEGLKMLDMANMRDYYNLVKADENQAKRENIKMANLDPNQVESNVQQAQSMKQKYLAKNFNGDENAARQDPSVSQLLDHFDQPIIPVNDWDNDQAHIFFHENFMKSQRFESLPPVIQDQFIKHRDAHKKKEASAQIAQLMQGGTAGAPPGPPPAGGMPGGGAPGGNAHGPNGGHNVQGNNQFNDGNSAPPQPGQQ
jgi:hypothetical protein